MLAGDYRRSRLFTLCQALTGFRQNNQLIADCDVEIESLLKEFSSGDGSGAEGMPKSQEDLKRNSRRNEIASIFAHSYPASLPST